MTPACHNIANGIKPGSNSNKTDKHVANCSKAVCLGVKDICEMYKLLYNNVAKGIRLLDIKKKQILFLQEKCHASKKF